ncbi:acyltransferase family protein [Bacillus pseudomycoides]|uniref:acyltransferase n=1 Tax=Bacillus pseudomycoides TaxID=64104 RepID=UPI001FB42E03|nr:acyltransferase family protein [Bacillus pseudomycoides]
MNSEPKKNYVEYIDVLRVFSMLAVVFLHTAAGSLRGNLGSSTWHISNTITAVFSTSVPIFFMISGAMLMRSKKTTSLQITYTQRLPKLVIPFVLWSIIAILYFGPKPLQITSIIKSILYMPNQATTVHLWFMYAIIPLYILSPILKKMVDSLSSDLVKYMLILWFVTNSLLPTIAGFVPDKLKPIFTLYADFDMYFLGGYLGYFLLGYYLMTYEKKISKKLLIFIIIIDTLIITLGTWYKTVSIGEYSEVFKMYVRVFEVILSGAIFLLAKEWFRNHSLKTYMSRFVQILSPLSFGVYLMHNLVVAYVVNKLHLWPAQSTFMLMVGFGISALITIAVIIIFASFKVTCYPLTGMNFKEACRTCNIQFLWRTLFKRSNDEK